MCGIGGRSGFAPLAANEADELSRRMQGALRHRGPDSGAAHHDGELLLIHRRLSIIDLSAAGGQPLWNETADIAVIVNGEIYNHRELRQALQRVGHRFRSLSDSEVLVHLYEDGGIERCCELAHGMFAFALWDARTRDLFLVRDRLGIKPLVYAEHREGITFASTLAGLMADPAVPRELSPEALHAFLKWGFVPTPWSALRAARHLRPGTWLRVHDGRLVEERQWWIDSPRPLLGSDEQLREAIRAAIASHLVADVPVATLLSGGVDSGLVSLLAAREGTSAELRAYTVSHRGDPEDEWADARALADLAQLSVHEVPIGARGLTASGFDSVVAAMDEPLATSSMVGLWELFRAITSERRVVLSGDGGDELMGGYDWHIGMPGRPAWADTRLFRATAPALALGRGLSGRLGSLGRLAALTRRHAASVYLDKLRLLTDVELAALGVDPLTVGDPIEAVAQDAWDRFAPSGVLEQMLAVDRATALVDEMLAKVDAASMSHSVEVRVPLLDDGVLWAAVGLPPDRKRQGALGKVSLREWLAELGASNASRRGKTGFNSPVAKWLEGPASEHLAHHAEVGRDLMQMRGLPRAARAYFALAIVGAWTERIAQPAVSSRGNGQASSLGRPSSPAVPFTTN